MDEMRVKKKILSQCISFSLVVIESAVLAMNVKVPRQSQYLGRIGNIKTTTITLYKMEKRIRKIGQNNKS